MERIVARKGEEGLKTYDCNDGISAWPLATCQGHQNSLRLNGLAMAPCVLLHGSRESLSNRTDYQHIPSSLDLRMYERFLGA